MWVVLTAPSPYQLALRNAAVARYMFCALIDTVKRRSIVETNSYERYGVYNCRDAVRVAGIQAVDVTLAMSDAIDAWGWAT